MPRAGSSVAVIPDLRRASSRFDLSGETVLYHEYAHHFMIASLTSRAFPLWFTEGFAEFFAACGSRKTALSCSAHRPTTGPWRPALWPEVPIRTLLAFDGGASDPKVRYDSFYGQSWVLFHYLQMAPERKGQLSEYQQQLAAGRSALEAAEGAFGDLDQLEKDMEST